MELQHGAIVTIWITGMTRKYQARVEQVDPPRLRVIGEDGQLYAKPLPIVLKQDDFIVLEG